MGKRGQCLRLPKDGYQRSIHRTAASSSKQEEQHETQILLLDAVDGSSIRHIRLPAKDSAPHVSPSFHSYFDGRNVDEYASYLDSDADSSHGDEHSKASNLYSVTYTIAHTYSPAAEPYPATHADTAAPNADTYAYAHPKAHSHATTNPSGFRGVGPTVESGRLLRQRHKSP